MKFCSTITFYVFNITLEIINKYLYNINDICI